MSTRELKASIIAELDYFSEKLLADVEAYVKSIQRPAGHKITPLLNYI